LEALKDEVRSIVFYESPRRLLKTLQQLMEVFGEERQVSVAREISKLHEEHVRGTLKEVVAHFEQTEPLGEIVIVLGGRETKEITEEKEMPVNPMQMLMGTGKKKNKYK
jgi:16S rRNA (cytidine1402-2'-O)-methyltransferase